ncbi:uncharacterized protein [Triticum aestivum]|uniref:uncharacterized protein n=1 Tax=Triticum aestivum TaxID=4565 RepID=UPI001D009CBD|nr:uncharacterized protein LOC123149472 [Triticum aestivum]
MDTEDALGLWEDGAICFIFGEDMDARVDTTAAPVRVPSTGRSWSSAYSRRSSPGRRGRRRAMSDSVGTCSFLSSVLLHVLRKSAMAATSYVLRPPHHPRYDCIVGYLVLPITISMT